MSIFFLFSFRNVSRRYSYSNLWGTLRGLQAAACLLLCVCVLKIWTEVTLDLGISWSRPESEVLCILHPASPNV